MSTRSTTNAQHQFFLYLKEKAPAHLSFVDELSSILHLSVDSVYRRIRGEKPLLLNEIYELCKHYNASFDSFFSLANDHISFKCPAKSQHGFTLQSWLANLRNELAQIAGCESCSLELVINELTCFHYFQERNLATFKLFYWETHFAGAPLYPLFDLDREKQRYASLLEPALEIGKLYRKIEVNEMWSKTFQAKILTQINATRQGLLMDEQTSDKLMESVSKLIERCKARANRQCDQLESSTSNAGDYQLHLSGEDYLDSLIVAKKDDEVLTFLPYHEFWGWLSTADKDFANQACAGMATDRKTSRDYCTLSPAAKEEVFQKPGGKMLPAVID